MKQSLLFFITCFLMVTSYGATIRVKVGGDDANDGSTWVLAKSTVQSAIDAAVSGDEVWVAGGTYIPQTEPGNSSPTDPRKRHILLKREVALYGGFAGNETLLKQRDTVTNITTLSGDLGTAVYTPDNCYNVVKVSGHISHTTTIDGFTISVGYSVSGSVRGAGMLVDNFSPTIRNCTFFANSAINTGGGLELWVTNAVVEHCTFSHNTCAIGGGISVHGGSPSITSCTFTGNTVSLSGGGLYATQASGTIENCTFYNNSQTQAGGYGGGIACVTAPMVITNCTVVANQALRGGGIHYTGTAPTVSNCIVWGNMATSPTDVQVLAGATVSNSIIQDGYAGSNIVTTDPLLLGLADNGGDVQTMAMSVDSSARNIASSIGAPTVDARGMPRIDTQQPDAGAYEFDTFTIEYVVDDLMAGSLSGLTLQYIDKGANASAVTAQANANYHFYRWEKNGALYSNHAAIQVLNLTESMTLTARFNAPPVAIATAISSPTAIGSEVTLSGSGSYDPDNAPNPSLAYQWTFLSASPGSITTAPLANANAMEATFTPTEAGVYTFLITVDDGAGTDAEIVQVVVNTAYTITAVAGTGGQVRLGDYALPAASITETIASGSDSSLLYALPATGYSFSQWDDTVTANPRCFENVAANQSIAAEFTANTYTVTFLSTSGGTITGTPNQSVAHDGSCTEVIAVALNGYSFIQWTRNGTAYSSQNALTVSNITNAASFNAVFQVNASAPTIVKNDSGSCSLSAHGSFASFLPVILALLAIILIRRKQTITDVETTR